MHGRFVDVTRGSTREENKVSGVSCRAARCGKNEATQEGSWSIGGGRAPYRGDSSPKDLGELLTLPAAWGQFSEVSGRTVAPWWLNWGIHGLMEHKGSARLHTGATVLPKPWENCSLCPPAGDSSPSFLEELSAHDG